MNLNLSTKAEQFVQDHLGLVAAIAGSFKKANPRLDYDDCYQDGCVGLLQAARRYRPDGGNAKAFARRRIEGAIIDGIRRRHVQSRHARAGDWPVVEIPLDEFCSEVSSDEQKLRTPVGLTVIVDVPDPFLRRRLRRHLRRLSPRDQLILRMRYSGYTMAEIGAVLGITVGRVSQVHRRILIRLQEVFRGDPPRRRR